ncbi:MAG: oligopeptide/dipeptide transporter, ATPase subunit [Vampirovibrio sp.]|jgi:oligopeptide/dipeptide ABC transporter ATP-binding protein|nr:oligopeptide/dipeptide transporter, ATPase subunit [Vampirovibrio sp.]
MSNSPLLQIQNLTVAFPTEDGPACAINHLSLDIQPGEVLGLVGESGCGKSMTSLATLRLIPSPGYIASGSIHFKGQDLLKLNSEAMRKIRGAEIALIPQDPLTSLNPVYTIGDQIVEVLQLHQGLSKDAARKRAAELLDMVRIPNSKERLDDYPHQFSGGMRQRVMIAMALSCTPALLIADEPTTALDVTVQAQILELLREIRREHQTAIMLITHDLGVVAEMCDEVAVMYAGRVVEKAKVLDLFKEPKHPYTWGLLESLPTMNRSRLQPIEGQPPSITEIPEGCTFEPRCSKRMPVCKTKFPLAAEEGSNHQVCCYLYPGSYHPEQSQDQTPPAAALSS